MSAQQYLDPLVQNAPRFKREEIISEISKKSQEQHKISMELLEPAFPTIEYEVHKKFWYIFEKLGRGKHDPISTNVGHNEIRNWKYESTYIIEPRLIVSAEEANIIQPLFKKEYMFAFAKWYNEALAGWIHMHIHMPRIADNFMMNTFSPVYDYTYAAQFAYPIRAKIGKFGDSIRMIARKNWAFCDHHFRRLGNNQRAGRINPWGYRCDYISNDKKHQLDRWNRVGVWDTDLNSVEFRANNVADLRVFGAYKILLYVNGFLSKNLETPYKSTQKIANRIKGIANAGSRENAIAQSWYDVMALRSDTTNDNAKTRFWLNELLTKWAEIPRELFDEMVNDLCQAEMDVFGTTYFQSYIDEVMEHDMLLEDHSEATSMNAIAEAELITKPLKKSYGSFSKRYLGKAIMDIFKQKKSDLVANAV